MKTVAGVTLVALFGGAMVPPPITTQVAAEEVRTKKLVVVDSAGEPRAIISTTTGGDVALTLHAPNGNTMVALALLSGGQSSFNLYDPTAVRLTVAVDPKRGGAVLLSTADGKTARMITEKGFE